MSTTWGQSGRRSGRVAEPDAKDEVTGGVAADKAPESRSSSGGTPGTSERRARRVSRRQLLHIGKDLTTRERAILTTLDHFRYVSSSQLQALHFDGHATEQAAARICRRVLARMHELRIVDHLDRRVGGVRAGSASYVWRVGPVGQRLLRQATDARVRHREPSLHHLDHVLAVADCYVALVRASRRTEIELLDVQAEPASWRTYLAASGARETLKPDLCVATASGEFEDRWFVEIDRATESLPTVIRKCRQYEAYRRTGTEQHDHGVFPRVLWVVPDERRVEKLTTALRAARGLDTELFRITTTEQVATAIGGGAA